MTTAQASAPGLEDRPQYYARHLAELNKTKQVVSTEDIYNDCGVLVARQGTRITEALGAKLLEHRLARPLHGSVSIGDTLSEQQLLAHHRRLFAAYRDLAALLQGAGLGPTFERTVAGVQLPPLFLQSLTVLEHRRPDTFDKALFGAVLAYLIAHQLDLPASQVRAAYLAGLVRDIGLLHIDPGILNKRTALSAEEWRAVQSHAVVGQLLVESVADRVPPLTARAVLEHHERCDGSGYPSAQTMTELHVLGQIVAMADSLEAIRVNQFARLGLNLANAVPFLQVNQTTHFYEVYATTRKLLRQAGLQPVAFNPTAGPAAFARRLLERSQRLAAVLPALETLREVLGPLRPGRRYRCLRHIPERVMKMIHSSGLLREELLHWLEQAAAQSLEGLLELGEMELLHNELRWQLGSVRRALDAFLAETEGSSAERQPLSAVLDQLEACLEASASS